MRYLLKKILRGLFTIIGIILGYIIGKTLTNSNLFPDLIYFNNNEIKSFLFQLSCMFIFGLILFLIYPWINLIVIRAMDYIEKNIQKFPANEILFGTIGVITGLAISALFAHLLNGIPVIGPVIAIVSAIIMAALGSNIATKKREEFLEFFYNISLIKSNSNSSNDEYSKSTKGPVKILDTSVIIDGRILDISKTGFIEGTLIVPTFVLQELNHIANSSDDLKMVRGQRGLDILNKIQKNSLVDVEICEQDFPEIAEVDSKLLKLAQVLNGNVLTTDYNLNKVAEFQGVPVLNINELANSVKPVLLPGEEIRIQVIKDGKELNQGVAYLDDGTMIVVEGGRNHVGKFLDVLVTSVLQTAAGRMIFAKRKK